MTFRTGATFSDDMVYRYRLWRRWDEGIMPVLFILLNPPTAHDLDNDPTMAHCIEQAKRLGFGGVEVCNLYAFRSTDPKVLRKADDPVGPENPSEIGAAAAMLSVVICGWGEHAETIDRGGWITSARHLIGDQSKSMCLGINKDGSPKYPLGLSYDVEPVPFVLDDD